MHVPVFPAKVGSLNRRVVVQAGQGIKMRPYLKNSCSQKGLGAWLKCLLGKCKILSSNPSTAKKGGREKKFYPLCKLCFASSWSSPSSQQGLFIISLISACDMNAVACVSSEQLFPAEAALGFGGKFLLLGFVF
jgi:hypothetical protein